MDVDENFPDFPETEDDVQHIMSLSWDKGTLGAVHYNLTTMELSIMHESVDLRPDYPLLSNLLRQVCPSYLLLCGPLKFVQDMFKFLKLADTNLAQYKVSKSNYKTTSNIVIFPHDQQSAGSLRQRVLKLNLPALPDNATDSERGFFLESVLPLNQQLVVQSLGNLLVYMDHNWKHVYLAGDDNPVIANLNVYHMESQVLIDESTFYALQIFTARYFHPSALKQGSTHAGASVYELFVGRCVSTIGVRELRTMLQQPTRDILELNLRHATIEFCAANETFMVEARKPLKNVLDMTYIFQRIVKQCGEKASDFKSLKKSVYNMYLVCQLCNRYGSVRNTFMYDLGNVIEESNTLKMLLFVVDRVVDLEESEKEKRFVVKRGLKPRLDEQKDQLVAIQNATYEAGEFDTSEIQR
jgi:DNA mismatch repair ATPase MutS